MGVAVSTHTSTSPLTIVSTVIGFVSFSFTLATFIKVTWTNLSTFGEAPHEAHRFLTNIRSELVEERANLRLMKRAIRRAKRSKRASELELYLGLDENGWKVLNDYLRNCIKEFKTLEKPFLADGEQGIREISGRRARSGQRHSSISPPRYSHGAYSSPPEKSPRARNRDDREGQWETEEEGDPFWAQRTNYAAWTLNRRFKWLTHKPKAQDLASQLARMQIRRIAIQVSVVTWRQHEYAHQVMDLEETTRRIDERVSRVIGVRRVPD